MKEAQDVFEPLIHCTPPTDPAFLASVSRAYSEATEILSSEASVFVGTLVRLRTQYPAASIIPLSLTRQDAPFVVWLVSREGWTEIQPAPASPERVASDAVAASQAAAPRA